MRLLIILSLLYVQLSFADKSTDAFLCIGSGITYTTTAPKGWKLDNESGKANNLCLVGYPINSSWENGENVIYLNATPKGEEVGSRDVADMIEFDIAQHKKVSPSLKVKNGDSVSRGNQKVKTKYFFNEKKKGNFEAVGYIDEATAVIFVVMSSQSKKGFEKSLPAFKEFIRNYKLIHSEPIKKVESTPVK